MKLRAPNKFRDFYWPFSTRMFERFLWKILVVFGTASGAQALSGCC